MSDIDFEHIANLFALIKGNAEHSGKFAAIQNEAFTQLNAINDKLRESQMSRKAEAEAAVAAQPKLTGAKAIPATPPENTNQVDPNLGAPVLNERRV